MRNIFDQYSQPENRLTHALMSTLYHDRSLIIPFLRKIGVKSIPSLKRIRLDEQQAPGIAAVSDKEDNEGLPDACFFDNDGWAVLIESKVQAKATVRQLKGHIKLAEWYSYYEPQVVLLAVDPPPKILPPSCQCIAWRDVYDWFCKRANNSNWARKFIEYIQLFEGKLLAHDYEIRGTLTMFSGFNFSEDNPYTYREGKRLLRLMSQNFRGNKRLEKKLGLNPKGEGRPAITQDKFEAVWDFIPLKSAKGKGFTSFPHATMVIRPWEAAVAITIPNNIKGGIKSRLKEYGKEGIAKTLKEVERNLRPVLKKVPGAKPMLKIVQRHYKSRRSQPVMDGYIEVDLRTMFDDPKSGLPYQPGWLDAAYYLLLTKKTNIQASIEVHFPYTAPIMHSKKALEPMAEVWIALEPFLHFGLKD